MDLETENRIAVMLLKEAAELRRQAEKEGVQAYLRQPKPRGRPNSRFLTATVLGVQQANRAVEESEMWQARQKELELDNRLRRRMRDEDTGPNRYTKESGRTSNRQRDVEVDMGPSYSSRKRVNEDCDLGEDEGLRDQEVDEFLHSRIKRGRGAVGSRMDETGPYLPSSSDTREKQLVTSLVDQRKWQEKRVVLGPEKPSSLGCSGYLEDESFEEKQKVKKLSTGKEHSKTHKAKDKSRDKEKKKKKRARENKRCKHRK